MIQIVVIQIAPRPGPGLARKALCALLSALRPWVLTSRASHHDNDNNKKNNNNNNKRTYINNICALRSALCALRSALCALRSALSRRPVSRTRPHYFLLARIISIHIYVYTYM